MAVLESVLTALPGPEVMAALATLAASQLDEPARVLRCGPGSARPAG